MLLLTITLDSRWSILVPVYAAGTGLRLLALPLQARLSAAAIFAERSLPENFAALAALGHDVIPGTHQSIPRL